MKSIYIIIKILNKTKKLNGFIEFFKLESVLSLFLKFIKDLVLNKVNFILIFINKKNFVNFNWVLFKKFFVKFFNVISMRVK